MSSKAIAAQEQLKDVHFPLAGIDLSQSFDEQPNRPLPTGDGYARTTPLGINVRSYEPGTGRARGGSRPGLAKYIPVQVFPGATQIQHINLVVDPDEAALLSYPGTDPGSGITPMPPPPDPGGGPVPINVGAIVGGGPCPTGYVQDPLTGACVQVGGTGINPGRRLTPHITWPHPADIDQGTALSSVQLDATAQDPFTGNPITGTFVYNPPSGRVLPRGTWGLAVIFYPDDAVTYRRVGARNNITVKPPGNIRFVSANASLAQMVPQPPPATITTSTTLNVVAQNDIFVWITLQETPPYTLNPPTDNKGNSYSLLASTSYIPHAGGWEFIGQLWHCRPNVGGTTIITAQATCPFWPGILFLGIAALQYSGIQGGTPLDGTVTSNAVGGGACPFPFSTGVIPINHDNELALGLFYFSLDGENNDPVADSGIIRRIEVTTFSGDVHLTVFEALPKSLDFTITGNEQYTGTGPNLASSYMSLGASFKPA